MIFRGSMHFDAHTEEMFEREIEAGRTADQILDHLTNTFNLR
jgi:hypothetical protein